jgi:hypothetical protein
VGLFEVFDTFRVTMVAQVKLLSSYNLLHKLITHMKDEASNLSALAKALSFVVSCAPLKLVAL